MKKLKCFLFMLVAYFFSISGISAVQNLICEHYYSDYNDSLGNIGNRYCPFVLNKELKECNGPENRKKNIPYGKDNYIIIYKIQGKTYEITSFIYRYDFCDDNDSYCLKNSNYAHQVDLKSKYNIVTKPSGSFFGITEEEFAPSKSTFPEVKLKEGDSCPDVNFYVSDDNKSILLFNQKENFYSDKDVSNIEKEIDMGGCKEYTSETACESNDYYSCVWVDNEDFDFLDKGYCNVDNLLFVDCGGASDIPMQVPSIISMLVNMLKIATPIILIIISMITLVKALSAGKEDEIKKATSSLVKKMIAAALVFFVVAIVQFVISKVAEDDEYEEFDDCLNCFLNNSCSENMYYKTVIGGQDWCTDLTTGNSELCNPDE